MSVQPTPGDLIDPSLRQEGPTGPLHLPNGQPGLNPILGPSSSTSGALPAVHVSPVAVSNAPAAPSSSAASGNAAFSPNNDPSTLDNAPIASINASTFVPPIHPPNVQPGVSEDARALSTSSSSPPPINGAMPPPINGAMTAGALTGFPQVQGALIPNASIASTSATATAIARQPATHDDSDDSSKILTIEEASKRPPGRQTWAKGHKLAFLLRYKDAYSRACITDQSSHFYDYITKIWLWCFGYDQPLTEDSPTPPPNPPDSLTIFPGLEDDVADDVKTARGEYIKMLRLKLRQWYYQQCKTVRQRETHSEAHALLRNMQPAETKKPRKLGELQAYAKWCWADRIKETFDERWALIEPKFNGARIQGRDIRKEKSAEWMKLQRSVLKELWQKEDQETKDAVVAMIEVEHQKAVDAASIGVAPPTSPEEYDQILKNIAPYLKSVADSIFERTGMVCSILLAGPIPEEGGRLAVRSMHTGQTKGADPRDWPATDPVGWEEVENCMVKFARMVYTPADMFARALSIPQDGEGGEDSGLSAAGTKTTKTPAVPSGKAAAARSPPVLPAKAGPPNVQDSLAPPRCLTLQAGHSEISYPDAVPSQTSHSEPQAKQKQRPKPRPVILPSSESNAGKTLQVSPSEARSPSTQGAPADANANLQNFLRPPSSTPADSTDPQGLSPLAPADDSDLPDDMDSIGFPMPSTIGSAGPRGLPWPPSIATTDGPDRRDSPWSSSTTPAPTGSTPLVLEWKSVPADFCTQWGFENTRPTPSAPSTLPLTSLQPSTLSTPSANVLPDDVDIADFPGRCRDAFKIVVDRYRWTSHHPRWGVCVQGMLKLEISSGYPEKDARLPSKAQKLRPVEFVEWFRGGRKDVLPEEIDIRTFSRSCWAWWLALQPNARGLTKQERPSNISLSEWNKCVRKPTISGFYLILVALVWWGTCLFEQDRRETLREWEQLVDDLAWAVDSWSAAADAQDADGHDDRGADDDGGGESEGEGAGEGEGEVDNASGTQGRGKRVKPPPQSAEQAPVNKRRTRSAAPSRPAKKRRR